MATRRHLSSATLSLSKGDAAPVCFDKLSMTPVFLAHTPAKTQGRARKRCFATDD
jgi:hypothetical protein